MADAPKTAKVVDTRKLPSADPGRMGKWDTIVIYELDNAQRYAVTLPAESLTEATLLAAIRADIAERSKWLMKPLQL